MRIRMLATSAGPDGVLYSGGEYNVDDDQAAALCAGGYAVPVGQVETVVAERREEKPKARNRR